MSPAVSFLKRMLLALGVVFFQVNVFSVLDFIPVKPDLFLVLAVVMAKEVRPAQAVSWGAFLGLLKDIFSIRLFGFNSLVLALEAVIISFFCRRFYKESLWFDLALVLCAGGFYYILLTLVTGRFYLAAGMSEAALNCLLFPLVKKIHNFTIGRRDSDADK